MVKEKSNAALWHADKWRIGHLAPVTMISLLDGGEWEKLMT
jgi:hypothetical protein